MVISKKFRYGLRSLVELGARYLDTKKPVSVREIAQSQGISTQFVANIFHEFMKAGLIKGEKGRSGGVFPARPLSKITILELVKIIDDPFADINCLSEKEPCSKKENCKTTAFWKDLSEHVYSKLEKTTIESIINSSKKN